MSAFTADLADRAAAIRFDALTGAQRERVRQCVLDWIGVTVAGAQEPSGRAVRAVLAEDAADGPCTVLGTTASVGPQAAAHANGTASHAQDYDDISFWMQGHPSIAVASAVFAVAELHGLAAADAVAGLVAGYEVSMRFGLAVGKRHYLDGWHTTATVGSLGAAAGAGRALGLGGEATRRALGLAATQAAGLKVSFGSMAKPLHGGRAAAVGVASALLAERGFTGSVVALEGPQGFVETQAAGFDPERPDAVMRGRLGLESICFKKHPACGATHATIDALQRAFAEHDLDGADVEHVRLRVTREMLDICCIEQPTTGVEGMFSVRHAGAVVLAGRGAGLAAFTDDAVRAPDVLEAARKIELVVHPDRPTGIRTEVTVRARGDEIVYDDDERTPAPDDELPQLTAALQAKFRDLTEPLLGVERAAELLERVSAFEHEPAVGGVLHLTRMEDGCVA
jgi:2-methylcitrate dehydratase PrpD